MFILLILFYVWMKPCGTWLISQADSYQKVGGSWVGWKRWRYEAKRKNVLQTQAPLWWLTVGIGVENVEEGVRWVNGDGRKLTLGWSPHSATHNIQMMCYRIVHCNQCNCVNWCYPNTFNKKGTKGTKIFNKIFEKKELIFQMNGIFTNYQ